MDPRALVISLANEAWVSRCLHVVAELRVADGIGEDGRPIQELAAEIGADPRILGTILRILSQRGIFCVRGGDVHHTPASDLIRSDNPVTLGDIVRWMGSGETWRSLEQLVITATEGRSGFEIAFQKPFFEHLAEHEPVQSLFNRSMAGFTRKQVSVILATLDFCPYRSILDIGGGMGLLATALAQKHPDKEIVLFEMPGVIANEELDPKVSRVAGNFFTDQLPAFDLGILMNVLHDWQDAEAIDILKSARRTLLPSARIMVIEGLMSEGESAADLLDLGMAVITGGIQRSREDFDRLFSVSGFEAVEQLVCSEHLSAILARPI